PLFCDSYLLSLHDALPIWSSGALSGVEPICRAIGVPVSTYYARRSGKPSRRELADRKLVTAIYAANGELEALAGSPATRTTLRLDRKSTRLNSSHEWISYA